MTKKRELKRGYSTGACAVAVSCAAWLALVKKREESSLPVYFPNGEVHSLSLLKEDDFRFSTIKDAGDDPDVTHGCKIRAESWRGSLQEISDRDYQFFVGQSVLVVQGGEGVGLCTRKGLDCRQGAWAINKGPLNMLLDNLKKQGLGKENEIYFIRISIEKGEELALKTLNPYLGIEGGLSILGTTGFVEPYSHDAYFESVKAQIKMLSEENCSVIFLATGGRTLKALKGKFPEYEEYQFVMMGDFIGKTLQEIEKSTLTQVIIGCMPGKLVKYASGFHNTHAHKAKQQLSLLFAEEGLSSSEKKVLQSAIANSRSVREVIESIPSGLAQKVYQGTSEKALKALKEFCPTTSLSLALFDSSLQEYYYYE